MEYNAAAPIYLQVINDLKKKMVKGELKPGEKMPASRELAVMYKVNQNTAARIYREMELEGYCFTKRGIGTFVSEEENMFENVKKEMAEYKPIPEISSFLDADGRDIMQEKIKENYRRIKQDALDIIEAEMKRIEKDEKLAEKLL